MRLIALLMTACCVLGWEPPLTNGMRDLGALLKPLRDELKFPALAGAVVADGKIAAAGAVGVRKWGATNAVSLGDKFHIGSITKSATALLAVMLGQDLETKAADVLPDWDMPKNGEKVTLRMLLQNRSGLAGSPEPKAWRRAFLRTGPPEKQRADFLREALRQPLAAEPGAKYIYSNLGFALAGAMIEKRAGRPWEALVRERIYEPLKLETAGFGPGWTEELDQPWGHQFEGDDPAPNAPTDNPMAIAPAGLIHMSVLDLARYAAFHLAVARGEVAELKARIEELYTPPEGSPYALGWLVAERSWAGGKVLNHAGSNTMFYAVVWIAPEKSMAFIVCTNIGDREGNKVAEGCDRAVGELIRSEIGK